MVEGTSASSGKSSKRVHDFSAEKWSKQTAIYVNLATQLPETRFDCIVTEAKQHFFQAAQGGSSVESSSASGGKSQSWTFDIDCDE